MPEVSIVTCTLDIDNEFFRTLKSIQSQKSIEVECIAVLPLTYDQKSLQNVSKNTDLQNLSFVRQDKSGIYNAMNAGLRVATGKYCLFLNAGDKLANIDSLWILRRTIGCGKWGYGRIKILSSTGSERYYHFNPFSALKLKCSMKYVPHPATLANTMVLKSLGGFDENLGIIADQDLIFRLSQLEPPKISSHVISVFTLGGMSSRSPFEILHEYRNWLKSRDEIILLSPRLNYFFLAPMAFMRFARSKVKLLFKLR